MAELSREEVAARIRENRKLLTWGEDDYDSDQDLKLPQPPLAKAAGEGNEILTLPKNFDALDTEKDFAKILFDRRSNRVYTEEAIDLLTFSFLCFAQQGVKGKRGKNYATLRTVASAGARHPFELYALVLHVEGLKPGYYHYLPLTHELELLKPYDPADEAAAQLALESLCYQGFALKGAAVFYYSAVMYRTEWRYACDAERLILIDAGHVTENLYLACSALGLGTCAIAAMDTPSADKMFGLNEEEEQIFYCAPVGRIKADEEAEQAFYAFLKDEESSEE